MTTLLAIDCSMDACSVALQHKGERYARFEATPRQHNSLLLPMIDSLISEAGITLSACDGFAYSNGPGSFTGVRIAASVIQGLAFAVHKPVVMVSTLQAIAQTAYESSQVSKAAVTLDARMNEVYFGLYEVNASGIMQAVTDDQIGLASDIEISDTHFQKVGSGWAVYAAQLPLKSQPSQDELIYLMPEASAILPIAVSKYQTGAFVDAAHAEPVYLSGDKRWKKMKPTDKSQL